MINAFLSYIIHFLDYFVTKPTSTTRQHFRVVFVLEATSKPSSKYGKHGMYGVGCSYLMAKVEILDSFVVDDSHPE
jgi:hypothetical protein